MSFYRDTLRKARKTHRCELCRAVILIGEKYHDKAGNQDGDIWTFKECEKCQPVIIEFMDSFRVDDGYCDDFIRDWWMEEKCHKCKHISEDDCEMTHYCRCEKFEKVEVKE